MRIICNVPYRASTKLLFQTMKILPFQCINKLQVGLFMYRFHLHQLPAHFNHWFCKNSDVHDHYHYHYHDHYTRSANYHQRSVHTSIRQHNIGIYGPQLWNSLPRELTCLPSVNQFKNKLSLSHGCTCLKLQITIRFCTGTVAPVASLYCTKCLVYIAHNCLMSHTSCRKNFGTTTKNSMKMHYLM